MSTAQNNTTQIINTVSECGRVLESHRLIVNAEEMAALDAIDLSDCKRPRKRRRYKKAEQVGFFVKLS